MRTADTIAAVASPPGRSARGLIRVSGSATPEALTALGATGPFTAGSVRSRIPWMPSGSLPLLLIRYAAPRSYTGEHAAEILPAGHPVVLDRLLSRLLDVPGVRHAEPGEFTARAYLNGKLTLEQAEGVAATIAARSDEELASARDLLAGTTGTRYRAWADELATLLALVEAGIDFTDQEDVRGIETAALVRRLECVRGRLAAFLGATGGAEQARALPRIVLAGPPNAGKSTLFNALLGRRRAVVSDIAGTTRDLLEEELDLSRDVPGAGCVALADLAGLDGGAPGGVAAHAQARALAAVADADAVIHCDPTGRFGALPVSVPVIRVRTKADLPGTRAGGDALPVCALDGWNMGPLRRAIADAAWSRRSAGVAALLPRHRRALESIASSLGAATAVAGGTDAAELAGHLRSALDAAGELVGRIAPDDILGRVFATFCVGK